MQNELRNTILTALDGNRALQRDVLELIVKKYFSGSPVLGRRWDALVNAELAIAEHADAYTKLKAAKRLHKEQNTAETFAVLESAKSHEKFASNAQRDALSKAHVRLDSGSLAERLDDHRRFGTTAAQNRETRA